MKRFFRNIGPGTFVAAAFIGPGTVTVCTLAGVTYGFTLLWAMLLSLVATMVLQEMAVRVGLVYGKGLAETIKHQITSPLVQVFALLLILSAVLIGNAAYEAGNISGAVLGAEVFFEVHTISLLGLEFHFLSLLVGSVAFLLLFFGNYKFLEKVFIVLVVLMSLSFLLTAISTQPNIIEVIKGVFTPKIPEEGILTVVALVGTTVVPYNLFLHAALVREKWKDKSRLPAARKDLFVSILLGGLVSMAIIICGAAIENNEVTSLQGLALSLEPLYGAYATYFLSVGMFAAGVSSAMTAPLAAAYVARECFQWQGGLQSLKFRSVWMGIVVLGVVFSSIGFKPMEVITFAQIANGLLLPVITGFLLWVSNRTPVLGEHKNTPLQNSVGVVLFLATIVLGMVSLFQVFGK